MFKQALTTVVALTGLAFSAPGQLHIHGKLGRHVRVSATFGGSHSHYASYRYPRPVVRIGYDDHGKHGKRGRHRRHGRRHHEHGHSGGYWRTVHERVWVPGGYREHHYPPRYGWLYDDCGNRFWGIVEAGGVRRVPLPGHYETRSRRIWVRY